MSEEDLAQLEDIDVSAKAMIAHALASDQQAFGSFFLSRFMGFEVSYGEDTCTVAFSVKAPLHNPQGTLHGGVIATAMDISMGHLLNRHKGPGTTLEMKVQYLSSIRAGRLQATARFLRPGRSVNFLQSIMIGEDGTEIAFATSTWKVQRPPNDRR